MHNKILLRQTIIKYLIARIIWLQGKQLYNNAAIGTIVSNQSLVLQTISRARAGLYTCVGHNQEGDGESNPVQLDVKCKLSYQVYPVEVVLSLINSKSVVSLYVDTILINNTNQ